MILKIGNIIIKSPLVLAPMAGVTDHAFRMLCKEHGVGLIYTEMISAPALSRAFNTINAFKIPLGLQDYYDQLVITDERPVAVQLFGSNEDELSKAAQVVEKKADIIDINLGCPSPKLTQGEMGSKLLLYPERIRKIVSDVSSTVKVPVTCKMRLGYESKNDAVKIAKICEKSGASAIAVHGRTTLQGYAGKADWNEIRKIKLSVSVPIIGNGDITTALDAVEKLKLVDAVMIGRAARGNPFIFSRTAHYIKTGKMLPDITREERINAFKRYVELSEIPTSEGKSKQERRNLADFKFQVNYFMNGFPGAASIRGRMQNAKSLEQIIKACEVDFSKD